MDKDRWISSTNAELLGTYPGLPGHAPSLERGMGGLYRQMTTQENDRGEIYSAAYVEKNIVRQERNRAGQLVWHIREGKIPLLADWFAEQKHWISSSNTKTLGSHPGLPSHQPSLERGMGMLHRRLVAEERTAGRPYPAAYVEHHIVRPGLNRLLQPVWQIHEGQIPLLVAWFKEEKQWISAGNWEKLRPLRISSSVEAIEQAIAELYEGAIKEKMRQGMGYGSARLEVEKTSFRPAMSEKANLTWQVHTSAIDELRDYLKHPPRVNSQSSTQLRSFGITASAEEIDQSLTRDLPRITQRIMKERQLDGPAAEELLKETIVRNTISKPPSWDLRRDFIPELLKHCPELTARKETGWLSVNSVRLFRPWKIYVTQPTLEQAVELLRDKKFAECEQQGMTVEQRFEAVEKVIAYKPAAKGSLVLKIHESAIPELAEFIKSEQGKSLPESSGPRKPEGRD